MLTLPFYSLTHFRAAPSKSNNVKDDTISSGLAPAKRARTEVTGDISSGKKAATDSNIKSLGDQPEKQNASSSSDYAVSERKPSFKKAEKSGFGHYKARQQGSNDNNVSVSGADTASGNKGYNSNVGARPGAQSTKSKAASSTLRPKTAVPAPTQPVYDAETIEYYRQMGYSYDPDYSAPAEQESGAREEDDGAAVENEDEEVRPRSSAQRARRPMSRAASQTSNAARATPPYPYPHTFGHYPGNPHHIPTPQGMPGMPGWGRSASMPFGPSSGRHAHARFSYPGGMMPPGAPPMPSMPMMPPMPGSFAGGSSMDEEALSNLIMAWYYSGYYTGLYQASQGR